jgi:hypothetical protein
MRIPYASEQGIHYTEQEENAADQGEAQDRSEFAAKRKTVIAKFRGGAIRLDFGSLVEACVR